MGVRHEAVSADQLRHGDLLRIGSSTNYVLVASASLDRGRIAVTVYDGDQPHETPTLHFAPSAVVDLSMRDARP